MALRRAGRGWRRRRNQVNVLWDRMFVFQDVQLNKDEFERDNIHLQVFDANVIMRNELIGQFAFGIQKVWSQPKPTGDAHSAVVSDGGMLFTWGTGTFGRLGLGDERDRHIPERVSMGAESVLDKYASPSRDNGNDTGSRKRQKRLEEYLHSLRYGQSEQQNRRVVAMEARSTLRKVTCLGVPCCVYGRLTDPMLVSSVNRYVFVGEKPVSGNLCCSVVVVVCCALHAY